MEEYINSIVLDASIVLDSIKFALQGQSSINEEYTTPHIKLVSL